MENMRRQRLSWWLVGSANFSTHRGGDHGSLGFWRCLCESILVIGASAGIPFLFLACFGSRRSGFCHELLDVFWQPRQTRPMLGSATQGAPRFRWSRKTREKCMVSWPVNTFLGWRSYSPPIGYFGGIWPPMWSFGGILAWGCGCFHIASRWPYKTKLGLSTTWQVKRLTAYQPPWEKELTDFVLLVAGLKNLCIKPLWIGK